MEPQVGKSRSSGYVVVLVGVLGFLVACFLPLGEISVAPSDYSLTLYRMMTGRRGALVNAGGALNLFGGTATIALISLAALRMPHRWDFPALTAASIVWSLTWIGTLLSGTDFVASPSTGFWLVAVSIAAVILGTILVGLSVRARVSR